MTAEEAETLREKRIANLKAHQFQKGQSGNAGGKPRGLTEIVRLAQENSAEAVETLASIMRDRKQAGHVRVSAANSILHRAYGRPKERVEAVVKQSLEDLVLASYRRSERIDHLPTGEEVITTKTDVAVAPPSLADLVAKSYRPEQPKPEYEVLAPAKPLPKPEFFDHPQRGFGASCAKTPPVNRIAPGQSLDSFMAEARSSERQPQFDGDLAKEAREKWMLEQFAVDPIKPRNPGL